LKIKTRIVQAVTRRMVDGIKMFSVYAEKLKVMS